jgi:hypothetical protein
MMHPVLANANPFKTSAAYLPAAETAVTEPSKAPAMAEVTAGPIPAGYVMVERDVLIGLQRAIQRIQRERNLEPSILRPHPTDKMPTFLAAPSRDYLDVIERGAA